MAENPDTEEVLKAAGLAPVVLQYQLPFVEAALRGDVLRLEHTRSGPVWAFHAPLLCPECEAGKHTNCIGDALDPVTDDIVDCQCPRCI